MNDDADEILVRVFRDMAMDERFFQGDGRELSQREINARCQLHAASKPKFTVEVKRKRN